MMNLINTAYTANLSVILAEDVGTPELRNPKLSGMSRKRKNMFVRFFKSQTRPGNNKLCLVEQSRISKMM